MADGGARPTKPSIVGTPGYISPEAARGEAPLPVIAAQSPGDCFATAYEAVKIAIDVHANAVTSGKILAFLRSSAVTERFATDNAMGGGGPSAEYAEFVRKEQIVWRDIVQRAGIKPD